MKDDIETPADMLERLRDNAQLWAQEFNATAQKLGYSDMDEGWLIGWFANAIEYSHAIRRFKFDEEAASLRSILDEAIAALEPFSDERNDGEHLWNATATDFARARATLTKLQAARNG
jgi:hypothetical protein